MTDVPGFDYAPAPDHPGWYSWNLSDETRFNAQVMGRLLVRREGENVARLRMFTTRKHTNLSDNIHGAVTLGLIDISLFAAFRSLSGGDGAGSVTLELSSQFIGAGRAGLPLDAVVEIMRETGRMVFLRGTVVQGEADENLIASFTGIVRKPAPRP